MRFDIIETFNWQEDKSFTYTCNRITKKNYSCNSFYSFSTRKNKENRKQVTKKRDFPLGISFYIFLFHSHSLTGRNNHLKEEMRF